mgnify:CR=1 FL=1
MTDVDIRILEEKDLFTGFLTSLDSLKTASDLNEDKAKDVFDKIKSNPNHLANFMKNTCQSMVNCTCIFQTQKS